MTTGRQIIRKHVLSHSAAGISASGESRAVPEDKFLLGEHHWPFNQAEVQVLIIGKLDFKSRKQGGHLY